jgi:hypothetical protein
MSGQPHALVTGGGAASTHQMRGVCVGYVKEFMVMDWDRQWQKLIAYGSWYVSEVVMW